MKMVIYLWTENGNKLLAEIGITDTEVFQNLTQAYMPRMRKL